MSGHVVIRGGRCEAFLTSQSRSGEARLNIVFQAEGVIGARTIRGTGEGSFRTVMRTKAEAQAWQSMCDAVDRLDGVMLSAHRQHADADVRSVLHDLDRGGALGPGVLAGLDMCLSDLAAQATGTSLADMLGAEQNQGAHNVTSVDVRRGTDQLGLLAPTTSPGVVRLTGIAGHQSAIEVAAAATNALGTEPAIWLELRKRLTANQAFRLVETLTDRMRAGHLSDHVVLHEPVADIDTMAELQAFADDRTGHVEGPGVVLMAHPRSADLVRSAVGRVRALQLSPHDLGGLRRTFDLAAEIHITDCGQRIALSLPSDTLGVAAAALSNLAAALPRCDYLAAPEVEADNRSDVAVFQGAGADASTIARARAAGRVTARYAPGDETLERIPANDNAPNDFSGEPILALLDSGARTGSYLLERSALEAGLAVTRFARDVITLDHADLTEPLGFAHGGTPWSGTPARRLVRDDLLTRRLLRESAVPTGTRGTGPGRLRPHREFLVVDGHVVSVLECVPPSVTGDGRSTVVDLVLDRNVARRNNPSTHSRPLELSLEARQLLEDRHLTLVSVPAAGQPVTLGTADDDSGDTAQVLDATDADECRLATDAARLIAGLDLCAVMVVDDERADGGRQSVVEVVDGAPDIARHHFPVYGPPVDVAGHLVRRSCELSGLKPSTSTGHIRATVAVWGRLLSDDIQSWLAAESRMNGLRALDGKTAGGTSEMTVVGNVESVAAVSAAVLAGPFARLVEGITTTPVEHCEQPTLLGGTP